MTDKKKQIQEYLASHVNTFVEPMVYDIVKKRPADPAAYALKWLTEHVQNHKQENHDSENEDVDEIPFDDEKLKNKIQKKGENNLRRGISEEVFGDFNKRQSFQIKCVPKPEETKLLILSLIRNSILFQNVDYKDQQILIDAMEEKATNTGQTIIQQGQNGDALFIVDSGEYDCYKVINGQDKYLKTYNHGDAFGELALMYNAPRAATIKVKTAGVLYSLDRMTFGQIVKGSSTKKRELYKKVIESIDIFADVSSTEKQQFYDILKEQKYEAGQYIIQQGDQGNKFYIVIEGKLVAEKKEPTDEFPKVVYKYTEGEYFGELALLKDMGRQASIKALTRVRVASINRDSFMRILGSFEDILKRNEERYHTIQEKMTCA